MLQAKSKNNKTYKNMVAVSNLYQYYWQALNSLKVPTNQVKNQNYITQLVINTINAELQYSPEVQQVTNGIKYELEFMQMVQQLQQGVNASKVFSNAEVVLNNNCDAYFNSNTYCLKIVTVNGGISTINLKNNKLILDATYAIATNNYLNYYNETAI